MIKDALRHVFGGFDLRYIWDVDAETSFVDCLSKLSKIFHRSFYAKIRGDVMLIHFFEIDQKLLLVIQV